MFPESSSELLDSILSESVEVSGDFANLSASLESEGSVGSLKVSYQEPGYTGNIDYRIRQLSYSSLLTLHSCPRKFQLYKLRTTHKTEEALKSTITFSFGHVVGDGIQNVFAGLSETEIIWKMFLGWHTPSLFDSDDKSDKNFFLAIHAIQKFIRMRQEGFLNEYDLVWYNGKPACELSFSITFPDGFRLRGFVDAVLRHKETGQVVVLECKTTGFTTINPSTHKNSAQAIGYSIVLDVIFPEISSYEVIYLIYHTKGREYNVINFTKSYLQRALWIRELLLDIEVIKMYEEAGIYPMRGENCVSFGRDCQYIQSCTLSTEYLTKPMTVEEVDQTEYQINLTLNDLIESQLGKTES